MNAVITDINQLDLNKIYTYTDYLSWKFTERVELIKGRIFRMSPAPSKKHQQISSILHGEIYAILKDRSCQIFSAPFDVKLSHGDEATVVQPDLCVICDSFKLTEQGCTGAPDLIIEILSPSNTEKEMRHKFELYEDNGVKEYWIVDYTHEYIIVYTLTQNGYVGSKPFVANEIVASAVLEGIRFPVEYIFEN